ncbi:MAG: hypothetical protein HOM55_08955 [Proteobacteria bacterium]|nr:hypothetical protein [Pseudomonadota bacterium]
MTKRTMRWFALPIAAVLSSISIAAPFAENPAFQQGLPLYIAPSANNPSVAKRIQTEQKSRSIRIEDRTYGKPSDFTAKARIAFKSDERLEVAEARAFTLESAVTIRGSGWRNEGGALYSWYGDMDARLIPLALPFTPENGTKPLELSDFEELWLDYTLSPGVPLCVPETNLVVSILPYTSDSKESNDITLIANANYSLKPIATIDTTQASWKKKEYDYLVRRVLGLAADEDWRYVNRKKDGLMQRRMNVQLDNVEAIDIAVVPGTSVTRVNLTVSRNDNSSSGKLVEFSSAAVDIGMKNITLSNGGQGIRLNLREALESRFAEEWEENAKEPGKHHFYLQEIFIYILGEVSAIAEKKSVRSLVFLRKDPDIKTPESKFTLPRLILESQVVEVNAFRRRMVVNLRELTRKGKISLKKAELFLLPSVGGASCHIRIEKILVVSTYSGTIPTFVNVVEDWSRRWGGIFNPTPLQPDRIEYPEIMAYLPFSVLTYPEIRYADGIVKEGDGDVSSRLPITRKNLSRYISNYGINWTGNTLTSDKRRLVSSHGVTLRGADEIPRATVEVDLLVLEGKGQALEVSWPLTARINNKTWFYFGVGEGVEQIGGVGLTLDLADGSIVQRQVVPNQPLRLVTGDVEVRNIRLRILPSVTPYRFKLREMALFAPAAASYLQAFTLPLPTPYNVVPKPVLQSTHASVMVVQPGHVAGLASNEPLRFSTPIDPVLGWVSGMRLNYRLLPTYKGDKSCSLSLQFNWTNGKTERQVCFEKPEGALFIPMTNWLGPTSKSQDLGALRSIDWVLRPITSGDKGAPESFNFQFSVDGWAMISAADHLRLSPLFNTGRYPVFADVERSNDVANGRYARKIWLPLEDKALPGMLAVGGQIQPVEHWMFTLDQVELVPKQPMSLDRWNDRTRISDPDTYIFLYWLAWFSVISLLALATAKKGWWSPNNAAAKQIDFLPDRASKLPRKAIELVIRLEGLLTLEPFFRRFFPAAAERVYGGAGSRYFFVALVILVETAILLSIGFQSIAEQLAIIVYYCLVIGTVQAILAPRKRDKKTVEAPNNE